MVYQMAKNAALSPQLLLLGFLMNNPSRLYELYHEVQREMGSVWRVGIGRLHVYLNQLVKSELAMIKTETQPGHSEHIVYSITPAGEASFLSWLQQPAAQNRHLQLACQTRLYFFHRLSLPGLSQFVAAQKAQFQEYLASLDRTIADTNNVISRMSLELRKGEIQALSDWLDDSLKDGVD